MQPPPETHHLPSPHGMQAKKPGAPGANSIISIDILLVLFYHDQWRFG